MIRRALTVLGLALLAGCAVPKPSPVVIPVRPESFCRVEEWSWTTWVAPETTWIVPKGSTYTTIQGVARSSDTPGCLRLRFHDAYGRLVAVRSVSINESGFFETGFPGAFSELAMQVSCDRGHGPIGPIPLCG
jgi:hypothetical protein